MIDGDTVNASIFARTQQGRGQQYGRVGGNGLYRKRGGYIDPSMAAEFIPTGRCTSTAAPVKIGSTPRQV
jgi:hypothetical protein